MVLGGYQILDLSGKQFLPNSKNITTINTFTVDGIYDLIKDIDKPVLVRGVTTQDKVLKSKFTYFYLDTDTDDYISEEMLCYLDTGSLVGKPVQCGVSLKITDDDVVTIIARAI